MCEHGYTGEERDLCACPSCAGLPLTQRRRFVTSGSMKAGPSEDYKALLRGEITPEEYVKRLKADVDARLAADRRRHGKP